MEASRPDIQTDDRIRRDRVKATDHDFRKEIYLRTEILKIRLVGRSARTYVKRA